MNRYIVYYAEASKYFIEENAPVKSIPVEALSKYHAVVKFEEEFKGMYPILVELDRFLGGIDG